MIVVTIISVIIAAISLIFVVINYATSRHDKSGGKIEEMKECLLKLNMKSDQICATTNETRIDIKAMSTRINEIDKELSITKRDLETAFLRIDELRERVSSNE